MSELKAPLIDQEEQEKYSSHINDIRIVADRAYMKNLVINSTNIKIVVMNPNGMKVEREFPVDQETAIELMSEAVEEAKKRIESFKI